MNHASVRVGLGTRVEYDGEICQITEWMSGTAGTEVVLTGSTSVCRMSLVALLKGDRAKPIPDEPGPEPDDKEDPAGIVLLGLDADQMQEVRDLAADIREVLTGYRSGSAAIALPSEPRPQYLPSQPLLKKYAAKAAELGKSERQLRRLVSAFRKCGEAGLATARSKGRSRVDTRWTAAAEQIMIEHTYESKPSKAAVIFQAAKRLETVDGDGSVAEPSRATAYRKLARLDQQHSIFGHTTKRNRDMAERPKRRYGKLCPSRPGEYIILDTTPLDVFALDPKTLHWVRVELTVAMDWYTRCIVAVRLSPTTKSVDGAAVMYQIMRPKPACDSWPEYATWPEHGMPREVLIDPDQFDRTGQAAASPALNPDTIIIDHGKIYVSEHLTSVCQRMGISIQPARIREGRDKGPLERFFRTVREGLLQYLPGYKGEDINARGLDVEEHAFFYIDQLEAIVREWIATVYHHSPHRSLLDPGMPRARRRMTPAQMFSHGITRAGYIEVPRDPQLAYEFLKVETRTIQHHGIQRDNLIYKPKEDDDILVQLRAMQNPYSGRLKDRWPIHVDPDDVTHIYIRHPNTRRWHELDWEHASEFPMPFSDEGLRYFRRIVRDRNGFVNNRLALDEMLTRWNLSMGKSVQERRIALRMARADAALSRQAKTDDATAVRELPSVQEALTPRSARAPDDIRSGAVEMGDDDNENELDDDYELEELEWK